MKETVTLVHALSGVGFHNAIDVLRLSRGYISELDMDSTSPSAGSKKFSRTRKAE